MWIMHKNGRRKEEKYIVDEWKKRMSWKEKELNEESENKKKAWK